MANYKDSYTINVEYNTKDFDRFKKAREDFHKKDTADDKANAKIKSDNNKAANDKSIAELKSTLNSRYVNLKAALQKEIIAVQGGKELEVKAAIEKRKILEAELKKFTNIHSNELKTQLANTRAMHDKELLMLRSRLSGTQRQRNAPDVGSLGFLASLKSEQRKFAPGSSDFTNLGVLIKGTEADLKKAGIEIQNFGQKINTGMTGALKNATAAMGPYLAGIIGIAGAQKVWNLSLDQKHFEVLRSNFKGTTEELNNLKIASANTVSEASLIKLSNQAEDLGISMKNQVILMSLAEDAADKYGGSVEENFLGLVNSTEGATKVLKTLGIQKAEYEETLKSLAKAQGLELSNLTAEQEKRLRLDALIKVTNVTYEQAISKTQDLADEQESLGVWVGDLTVKFGYSLAKGIFPFIGGIEEALRAIKKLTESVPEMISRFTNAADAVNKLTFGLLGLRKEAQDAIIIKIQVEGELPSLKQLRSGFTGSFEDAVRQLTLAKNISWDEAVKLIDKDFPMLKDPEGNSGTKTTTSNSGTKSRKEEKNAVDELIKSISNKIKLEEVNFRLEKEFVNTQRELVLLKLKENLAIEDEIKLREKLNELSGLKSSAVGGENGPLALAQNFPAFRAVFQPKDLNLNPAEQPEWRQFLIMEEEMAKQRLQYSQEMWGNFQGMLQATGLMKGQFGEIITFINSFINGISSGIGFVNSLVGFISSFIPGVGAIGAVGGLLSGGGNRPMGMPGGGSPNIMSQIRGNSSSSTHRISGELKLKGKDLVVGYDINKEALTTEQG